MLGMEQMLANMIGMKPADLKQMAEKLSAGATQAFSDIAQMKADMASIKARLEGTENGGSRPSE